MTGIAGQAGRFGLVGLFNTLLDFVLFHALTRVFGIPLSRVWIAKAISGSVALASSFYFNRRWVFRAGGGRRATTGQAIRFVVATLIGVYVIQTGLTQVFASELPQAGELAYRILPIGSEEFMIRTVAFALATAFSLTWNFLAYKFWVFRGR